MAIAAWKNLFLVVLGATFSICVCTGRNFQIYGSSSITQMFITPGTIGLAEKSHAFEYGVAHPDTRY